MLRTIILVCAFLVAGVSPAQQPCDAEVLHERLMAEDDAYRMAFEAAARAGDEADSGQVVTIPVVFHVIHLGEAVGSGSNLSDTRIMQALSKLNHEFRYANGIDMGIRFCLAQRGPDGRPTEGIVRVDGRGVPDYAALGLESSDGPGADETAIKDLSRWPNTEFYNIWVVHNIAGSVSGYAYYPTTYINDGTSIEALHVNTLFNTLTHEIGHAFDLRHTFQGDGDGSICPANSNCAFQGDYICDTPPHKRWDCAWIFGNPCTSNDSDFVNSWSNFMSYCGLTDRFTPEQRLRARAAALSWPRVLLSESAGCTPPPDAALVSIDFPEASQAINYCGDSLAARFTLRNDGEAPIDGVEVAWHYNGAAAVTTAYATDLAPLQEAGFALPPFAPDPLINDYTLEIAIAAVNGEADYNPANDSADVTFTATDTCLLTAAISPDGIGELSLYPNPVTGDRLTLKIPAGPPARLTISDASGRTVRQTLHPAGTATLNVSGLARGVYLVVLENDRERFVGGLVRE